MSGMDLGVLIALLVLFCVAAAFIVITVVVKAVDGWHAITILDNPAQNNDLEKGLDREVQDKKEKKDRKRAVKSLMEQAKDSQYKDQTWAQLMTPRLAGIVVDRKRASAPEPRATNANATDSSNAEADGAGPLADQQTGEHRSKEQRASRVSRLRDQCLSVFNCVRGQSRSASNRPADSTAANQQKEEKPEDEAIIRDCLSALGNKLKGDYVDAIVLGLGERQRLARKRWMWGAFFAFTRHQPIASSTGYIGGVALVALIIMTSAMVHQLSRA